MVANAAIQRVAPVLGAVVGIAAYFALFATVLPHQHVTGCDSPRLSAPCLQPAARTLLWPALASSRLGLTYSVLPMLVVAVGSLAWIARSGSRLARGLRTFRGAAMSAALYSALAWFYVFELPVPTPNVELLDPLLGELDSGRVREFYDVGYRIGILSVAALPDYYFGRSEAVGLGLGLALGEMEWRGLLPPVTKSAYAWMLGAPTSDRGTSQSDAGVTP